MSAWDELETKKRKLLLDEVTREASELVEDSMDEWREAIQDEAEFDEMHWMHLRELEAAALEAVNGKSADAANGGRTPGSNWGAEQPHCLTTHPVKLDSRAMW